VSEVRKLAPIEAVMLWSVGLVFGPQHLSGKRERNLYVQDDFASNKILNDDDIN